MQAGDKLKGKANEAGRKAQNAVGDNAGLPSPQDALDKAKDALPGGGGGAVSAQPCPAALSALTRFRLSVCSLSGVEELGAPCRRSASVLTCRRYAAGSC